MSRSQPPLLFGSQLAAALQAHDDNRFAVTWPNITDDQKATLDQDVRRRFIDWYRRVGARSGSSKIILPYREQQSRSNGHDHEREPPPEPTRGPRFQFLRANDVIATATPPWLLFRLIPALGMVVIWGASGSGKTFFVLDLFCAIVRGQRWAGRRTRRTNVVYIAAEGYLGSRLHAYLAHHSLFIGHDLDGLRILQSSVNLLDPHVDVDDLLADLRTLRDEIGPIGAIVIDTLNRVMPGGDENRGEDMGAVIANAKLLEAAMQCAVIFVHHSGKDESRGARGHNSLKAACDAEMTVTRDREGGIRTITASKVRDGEDGVVVMNFKLQPVDLGPLSDIDPDAEADERHTSCVVVPCDAPTQPGPADLGALSRHQALFLRCARDGENYEVVRTQFYRELGDIKTDAKYKAFVRAAQWSREAGRHDVIGGVVKRFDLGVQDHE